MIEKVAIAIRDSFNSNDIDCYPIAKAAMEALAKEPSDQMCWQMNAYLDVGPDNPQGKQAIQDVLEWALRS